MIRIAHRGNTNGRVEELENSPDYVEYALGLGYDVEIDLWVIDGEIYLGHDSPSYKVDFSWLKNNSDRMWVHCKNIEAIIFLQSAGENINYFWHENDKVTLTSKNFIWAFPGSQPIQNSIAVLPEINDDNVSSCVGICSDFISKYRDLSVALLITGQIRNAKESYPSIKEKILDVYVPDVFIETWSNSSNIKSHFSGELENDSTIDEIEKMYRPCVILSEEYNNQKEQYFSNLCLDKNPPPETKPVNVYAMHYKISKGFSLIEGYQLIGKKYDLVIRIRFDIKLESFIDLYEVDPEKIYIPEGWDHRGGINDLLAVGGYDVMKTYCNLYHHLEEYAKEGNIFHPETLLRVHLEKNQIEIERPKMSYFLRSERIS